jgi:hypothetical protein
MSRLLNVLLTTAGANTGPFDLYQCVGSVCEVIPVATGVLLSQISTGYTVTVNDGVNMIRVVSTGPCNRTVDLYLLEGCCPDGYSIVDGLCEINVPPLSGVSGTTITFITGDAGPAPARGTLFYDDVTSLPKPLTFRNFAQFNPITSGVTLLSNQKCELVDATNFTSSEISAYYGYNDSNISGTPVTVLVTGTTPVWKDNINNGIQTSAFMNGAIKYATSLNQWVGFTTCITLPTQQTLYFLMGSDDIFRLKVDGQWIVYRENISYWTNDGSQNSIKTLASDGLWDTSTGSPDSIYLNWTHVLPITLSAGQHTVEFSFSDIYNFGYLSCCTDGTLEIYSGVTTAMLTGFTTYSQLAPYTVFSTISLTGIPQTIISNYGSNYGIFCEPGQDLLDTCGTPYCYSQTTLGPCTTPPPTPTPTSTPTPTTTPTVTPTSTPTSTTTSTPTITPPSYGTYTLCFSALNIPETLCTCVGAE